MRQKNKILKKLSSNWLSKLDPEEVTQEELIQSWKDPDMEGYQGMVAFRTLLYSACKEEELQEKHRPLKKNTPDKSSGVLSLQALLYEYMLGTPEEDRGLYCLIVQPLLQSIYYGKDIRTLDSHSIYLGISRSNLGRTLKSFRDRLEVEYDLS